ncbi:hypothetical protein [Nostoc sp. DSM 114167]
MLRGGSWVNSPPSYCRSALRFYRARDERHGYAGFRVVVVGGRN